MKKRKIGPMIEKILFLCVLVMLWSFLHELFHLFGLWIAGHDAIIDLTGIGHFISFDLSLLTSSELVLVLFLPYAADLLFLVLDIIFKHPFFRWAGLVGFIDITINLLFSLFSETDFTLLLKTTGFGYLIILVTISMAFFWVYNNRIRIVKCIEKFK